MHVAGNKLLVITTIYMGHEETLAVLVVQNKFVVKPVNAQMNFILAHSDRFNLDK